MKYGKQITINGKDYEQNPENKLTLTMLGAFAEFERTSRGRLHRNGFSDLMVQVFGEAGKHARSAVGMAGLPGNSPIEVEMIVEFE